MRFLEWEDSYNIGVKEIDIQHRGLFDIVSRLFTSRNYQTEGKYFIATLSQFIDYTKVHFATEERYMREAEYPKLDAHQKEHNEFLSEVIELARDCENKVPGIEQKILDFLKSWYIKHILGTDRDYQKSFMEKGFK
ncbi:MAG: hemerythrin family protein [Bacteroidetes bacterium]|nr:hemerythrin family protein [Bacteroidota bacterium]